MSIEEEESSPIKPPKKRRSRRAPTANPKSNQNPPKKKSKATITKKKAVVKAKRAPVQKSKPPPRKSAVKKRASRGGKKKRHEKDFSDDTRSTASESSSSSDDDDDDLSEAPVRDKRKRTVSETIRGNSEATDFASGSGGDWRVAGAIDWWFCQDQWKARQNDVSFLILVELSTNEFDIHVYLLRLLIYNLWETPKRQLSYSRSV